MDVPTLDEPYIDEQPRLPVLDERLDDLHGQPKELVERPLDMRQLLSVRWQRRFALIDQAGSVELPKAYLLTEMQRFWLCFSFPAWVFGPLWYLVKGMWRKAIVLGALCYGVELLVGAVFFLAFGYEMSMSIATLTALVMSYYFFGARAVMDYYKATVLEDRSWL